MEEKTIVGFDPGTNVMGYACIKGKGQKIRVIECDSISFSKEKDAFQKLAGIFKFCRELIQKYKPDEAAIESPFYGKNIQSMLKLGRAQGVSIAAVVAFDIPVYEYAPRRIKQSITGNGNASKEQVASMLVQILQLKEAPRGTDASDALATAVCHMFRQELPPTSSKNGKGWERFIKENPDRLA